MRKQLIYTSIFLFFILFMLQSLSVEAEGIQLKNNTREFKETAIKMKNFLKNVDRLRVGIIKQKNGKVIIETNKITDYVLSHQKEFGILKNRLNNFIIKVPNSEWSEDANILLGAAYLIINLKETPFTQEAINTYSKIINPDQELKISPWTKELLSDLTVSSIFKPLPGEYWMNSLKESDIIKIVFSRALVTEYLKRKDFKQADMLMEDFKKRGDIVGTSSNILSLTQFISNWKKAIKE